MGQCRDCQHWIYAKKRLYADGSDIMCESFLEDDKALCSILEIKTRSTFGCQEFLQTDGDHIQREFIDGAPWQHFRMDRCPDCQGRGCGEQGGVCRRCAGTSKVRHYDDGFIGDERTRKHPSEPEESPHTDPGTVLAPIAKADPTENAGAL